MSSRRQSFYVKWNGGAIELRVSSEHLEVVASNGLLVFEPRSVEVRMPYTLKRDVEDKNRRTVFIEFRESVKPIEHPPRIDIVGRNFVGNFEVIYTDLEFETYLTVITPATYLYEYFVLTSTDLMLYMSSKRKVYFEEEPYERIIVYIT